MTTYFLTLEKGRITYKNGIYKGSEHDDVVWAPADPNSQGGWQNGDTLYITCQLDVNPSVRPQPGANEYVGLCAGSCKTNTPDVQTLERQALGLATPNPGQLLGSGITASESPTASNVFYNALAHKSTVTLHNGQQLVNYTHGYTLTYNGNNTVVNNGDQVEIVFGYGDPQEANVSS